MLVHSILTFMYLAMKAAPTRREPVPESAWITATRFCRAAQTQGVQPCKTASSTHDEVLFIIAVYRIEECDDIVTTLLLAGKKLATAQCREHSVMHQDNVNKVNTPPVKITVKPAGPR